MENYHCKVYFNVEPKKVYEAITKQKGLQSWWTTDCSVKDIKGSKGTFRFGKTYTVMNIEKLVPHTQVQWKCVDHHHIDDELTKSNEWVDTRIIFDLKGNNDGGTELSFTHEGLNKFLECFDICNERWGHFLKKSLKKYVETGEGEPYEVSL